LNKFPNFYKLNLKTGIVETLKHELRNEVNVWVSNLVLDIPKVPTYNSAYILKSGLSKM